MHRPDTGASAAAYAPGGPRSQALVQAKVGCLRGIALLALANPIVARL
jgi:hypothetical protein